MANISLNIIGPILIRITTHFLKGTTSILDAGTGNVALSNRLDPKFSVKEIIGFDFIPNDEPEVKEGNILDIHYSDEHIDVIFGIEVLEHPNHSDLLIVLQELIRELIN